MTSMHSYRHQPAAACIGGAVVAGGEALAARPVFRRLSAASQVLSSSGEWVVGPAVLRRSAAYRQGNPALCC